MKKALCGLLALTVVAAAVPLAAADRIPGAGVVNRAPLQAAINQSGPKVAVSVAPPATASSSKPVPIALPRSGANRSRRQGGSRTGMAIGLISTIAGAAATVYMVKEMKKNSDETGR